MEQQTRSPRKCSLLRAFLLVLVASVPVLAPSSALGARVWLGRSAYRLTAQGSSGYRFRLSTYENRLYQRITLIAEGAEGQYARYSVKGIPKDGRLRAVFPGVGKIDVVMQPKMVRELPLPKGCKLPKATVQIGTFVGTIKLRGEGGYTKLDAKHAHGAIERGHRQECPSPPAGRASVVPPAPRRWGGGPRMSTTLELVTGHVTAIATAFEGATDASFYAVAHERRDGMEIERRTPTVSAPGDFNANTELTQAKATPPLPFRGTAAFASPPASTGCTLPCSAPLGQISGTLRVPLSGLGLVPLTGPGVKTHLTEHTRHY